MQSEKLPVAVGLALLLIVPVDLLVGSAVQEVWQERVGERVLQVEDAAGPAASRRVVYGHGAPLEVVLSCERRRVKWQICNVTFQSVRQSNVAPGRPGSCCALASRRPQTLA